MSMRRHTFGTHVLTLTVAATGILAGCSSTSLSRAPIESRESNRGTHSPHVYQQQQHSTRPVIVDSNGNVINGGGQAHGQTHSARSHYPAGSTVQSYPVPEQNTTQSNTSGSLYPQGAVVSSGSTSNTIGTVAADNQAMAGQPGYYTVRAGDNIYRIGLNHQQRWQDIAAWNNLPEPYTISIGQVLRVAALPGEAPVATSTPVDTATTSTTTTTTTTEVSTPATNSGTWQWPARGKVVGKFNGKNNKGINIAGKRGAAVVASRAGSVVYAGEGLRGYGKLIIVKHDNTFLTAYAHNSKLLVKENQKVAQGQKIAEMGDSDAKRVMLHFEVRKDGKPVNPMGYLK